MPAVTQLFAHSSAAILLSLPFAWPPGRGQPIEEIIVTAQKRTKHRGRADRFIRPTRRKRSRLQASRTFARTNSSSRPASSSPVHSQRPPARPRGSVVSAPRVTTSAWNHQWLCLSTGSIATGTTWRSLISAMSNASRCCADHRAHCSKNGRPHQRCDQGPGYEEFSAYTDLSVGNYDYWRLSGGITGPVAVTSLHCDLMRASHSAMASSTNCLPAPTTTIATGTCCAASCRARLPTTWTCA